MTWDIDSGRGRPQLHKAGDDKDILRARDPEGFEIRLYLNTWEKRITRGHPDMADKLELVAKTIEQPEIIQQSGQEATTFCYYRLTGRTIFKRDDLYVLVVVHRDDAGKTGFVKTAHLTPRLRAGGNIIWFKAYRKSN